MAESIPRVTGIEFKKSGDRSNAKVSGQIWIDRLKTEGQGIGGLVAGSDRESVALRGRCQPSCCKKKLERRQKFKGLHGVISSLHTVEITDGDISDYQAIGSCDEIKCLLRRGMWSAGQPSTLRMMIWPLASKAQNSMHTLGAWQQALRLGAPLELFVRPLDGIGGTDGLPCPSGKRRK